MISAMSNFNESLTELKDMLETDTRNVLDL